MARLLQLAVFAALALITFAAPAPPAARSLAKRSFKAKAPGRRKLSAVEDRVRAQRKYQGRWEIIVAGANSEDQVFATTITVVPSGAPSTPTGYLTPTSTTIVPSGSPASPPSYGPPTYGNQTISASSSPVSPTSTAGSEDGTVAAVPDSPNEMAYLSPVTIGGQKFNLDFDTGSADLWVLGADSVYSSRTAYNPNKSKTWKQMSGSKWNITYGDGSGAIGFVGTDVVDVGGSTVQKQAIEVAEYVSDQFAQDEETDGLLGLAFSSINRVWPKSQLTFFDNVKSDLSQPLFTADLEESTGKGTYDFGTIDTAKYSGEMHYTPVDNSLGFWQIATPKVVIGKAEHDCSNCSTAIVDTGTSLMYLDKWLVADYYAKVPGSGLGQYGDALAGLWYYPCSQATKLPDFGVGIGDWVANIKGSDMHYARNNATACVGGLQEMDYDTMPGAILGDVFLKQFFVVFDGGNLKVGVAEKN